MSMQSLKPYELSPAWKDDFTINRVLDCRLLLHLHGFLSEAEARKVTQRIIKWRKMHGLDADPIEPSQEGEQ